MTTDQNIVYKNSVPFDIKRIIKELVSQGGVPNSLPNTNIFSVRIKNKDLYFAEQYTSGVPYNYGVFFTSRRYVREIFKKVSIAVPEGLVFAKTDSKKAYLYAEKVGFPVTLYTDSTLENTQVYANVERSKFLKMFDVLSAKKHDMIIQKNTEGKILRVFISKNGYFNTLELHPPELLGDGVSTIEQLIVQENMRRVNLSNSYIHPIKITKNDLFVHGKSLKDILPKSEKIILSSLMQVNRGAEVHEVTQNMKKEFVTFSKTILNCFPYLDYLTFECIETSRKSRSKDKHYIVNDIFVSPGVNIYFQSLNNKHKERTEKVIADLLSEEKF